MFKSIAYLNKLKKTMRAKPGIATNWNTRLKQVVGVLPLPLQAQAQAIQPVHLLHDDLFGPTSCLFLV
jgi:hypothetical protein